MKRVQKAAATLAALALTSAMVLPAGAVDTIAGTGDNPTLETAKHDVYATYQPEDVYHVDIAWQSMEFTYEPGVWMGNNATQHDDDETLTYFSEDGKAMGWNNNTDNNVITVTNKSNVDIGVDFDFEPSTDKAVSDSCDGRVSASFYDSTSNKTALKANTTTETAGVIADIWMERADKNVVTLKDGNTESDDRGAASEAKIHLVLSGRPKNKLENTVIGTVTVTIGADNGGDYSLYYESGATYNEGSSGNKPVNSREKLGYGGTKNVPSDGN